MLCKKSTSNPSVVELGSRVSCENVHHVLWLFNWWFHLPSVLRANLLQQLSLACRRAGIYVVFEHFSECRPEICCVRAL